VLVIRIAKARGKKKKEFDRETVAQHTVKWLPFFLEIYAA
jgi:hypothetical protein